MRKNNQPVWLNIATQIQDSIKSGNYKPNTRLPSLNNLAIQFDVNRNTARQALLYLQNIGLISVEQGRGTYVLDKPACITINESRSSEADIFDFSKLDEKLLSSELIIPDVKSENILYLNEADKIWRIKSMVSQADEPLALYSCDVQSNILSYFNGTDVLTPVSLEENARNNPSLFSPLPTTISAGLPEQEFKNMLGLKHIIPVLVAETNYIQTTEYSGNNNIVLSFKRYFVTNRVNLQIDSNLLVPMSATG